MQQGLNLGRQECRDGGGGKIDGNESRPANGFRCGDLAPLSNGPMLAHQDVELVAVEGCFDLQDVEHGGHVVAGAVGADVAVGLVDVGDGADGDGVGGGLAAGAGSQSQPRWRQPASWAAMSVMTSPMERVVVEVRAMGMVLSVRYGVRPGTWRR